MEKYSKSTYSLGAHHAHLLYFLHMSEFSRGRSPETPALAQQEAHGLKVSEAVDQLRVLLGSYSNAALAKDLKKLCEQQDDIGNLARAYETNKKNGIARELIDAIISAYPESAPDGWHGVNALAKELACSLDTLRPTLEKWLTLKSLPANALESRETWAPHAALFYGYIRFARESRGHQTFFFSSSMADELRLMLNESARSVIPRTSANTSGRSSPGSSRKAESRPTSPLARGGATPSSPSQSLEQALNAGLGITENNRQERINDLLRRVRVLLQNRSLVSRDHTLLQQAERSLAREGVADRDAQYYGDIVRRIEQDLGRRSRED